ncbi:hypothetical protein C1M56_20655 [Vibrio diazotrophicus]|nr:hypothetical protein C1M56_20655 [Vibrio diazotrophicus]
MFYNYVVLKKNDEYLAVITNQNTHWELGHYYDQGFTFFMNISAFNSQTAIEQAKQNADSEIGRLQAELASLQQEYQKLQSDYNNMKFSNSFGFASPHNGLNPMEIFGFKTMPTKQELKKQYKTLSLKVHSDRGGSDWLMRVVKQAYDQLNQQIA